MAKVTRSAVLAVGALLVAAAGLAQPVVTNVRAQQLTDGTRRVEVLYDLTGAPSWGVRVSVVFSSDNGTTWSIVPLENQLGGDVGFGIVNGANKRILWAAPETLPVGTYATTFKAQVSAADNTGQELVVTLAGGVPLVLVRIPAGTYMMGSPASERGRGGDEPQVEKTIAQDFYLGKYEITQAQWQAVMGSNPATGKGVGNTYPVYNVSWNGITNAGGFLQKLDEYLRGSGQPGAGLFRLPTEAEWEWAARAGTTTRFSFGDALDCNDGCLTCWMEQYMWWCGNNSPDGTKPVGGKRPNPWGLYDMHGNVREITQETHTCGSSTCTYSRGGYWANGAQECRSANRDEDTVNGGGSHQGFRIARSIQ